jgi:hypothetical protein
LQQHLRLIRNDLLSLCTPQRPDERFKEVLDLWITDEDTELDGHLAVGVGLSQTGDLTLQQDEAIGEREGQLAELQEGAEVGRKGGEKQVNEGEERRKGRTLRSSSSCSMLRGMLGKSRMNVRRRRGKRRGSLFTRQEISDDPKDHGATKQTFLLAIRWL